MAVTAGELLDAAYSFPFRSLREMLEDRPFIVIAPIRTTKALLVEALSPGPAERDYKERSWSTASARIRTAKLFRRTAFGLSARKRRSEQERRSS